MTTFMIPLSVMASSIYACVCFSLAVFFLLNNYILVKKYVVTLVTQHILTKIPLKIGIIPYTTALKQKVIRYCNELLF